MRVPDRRVGGRVGALDYAFIPRCEHGRTSATVEGVAFVLDLSEQKRAEDERKRAEEELLQREVSLREVQTELAHVGRVTTMGELASWQGHPIT